MAVLEEWRQRAKTDVAEFVDGRPHHCPAVFQIPGGIVRSTPEEGDSERSAAHNHAVKTSDASESVSGVPISRKRPCARQACIVLGGNFSKTSRSREHLGSRATCPRIAGLHRYTPPLIQALSFASGLFSSNRTTQSFRSSIIRP